MVCTNGEKGCKPAIPFVRKQMKKTIEHSIKKGGRVGQRYKRGKANERLQKYKRRISGRSQPSIDNWTSSNNPYGNRQVRTRRTSARKSTPSAKKIMLQSKKDVRKGSIHDLSSDYESTSDDSSDYSSSSASSSSDSESSSSDSFMDERLEKEYQRIMALPKRLIKALKRMLLEYA